MNAQRELNPETETDAMARLTVVAAGLVQGLLRFATEAGLLAVMDNSVHIFGAAERRARLPLSFSKRYPE